MVIGYVKSTIGSQVSCEIQKNLIAQYCKQQNLLCGHIFEDTELKRRTVLGARKASEELGLLKSYKSEGYFPHWDEMLGFLKEHPVKTILVESKGRIFTNKYQYSILCEICKEKQIEIREVCNQIMEFPRDGRKQVAVYHFTRESLSRPVIAEKELDAIYEFAGKRKDWKVTALYFDTTLKKSEQVNYQKFHCHAEKYHVLLTNDFYHIQTKTGPFMTEIKYLNQKNVEIQSLIDGKVQLISEEKLFQKPLRIAIYHSKFHEDEERSVELQEEIFRVFVKYKTNWRVIDVYIDECKSQVDGQQQELDKLIKKRNQYDLILVKCFHKFHWRTAMFSKRRKALQLPIYSLKEGYLNG